MLIMCIKSHNFGINNSKFMLFYLKTDMIARFCGVHRKIKPPTIFCVRRSFFFRRSRLFFREAAFSSGGEGCEWGAKQPTVGARGKKLKTRFQALSHSSSHERASALTSPPPDFLFISIHQNPTIPLKPSSPHPLFPYAFDW